MFKLSKLVLDDIEKVENLSKINKNLFLKNYIRIKIKAV